MVSYGRLAINFGIGVFSHMRWLFSYGTAFLPDSSGNMLLYSLFQPLRRASYVPSFTSARKFINSSEYKMSDENKEKLVSMAKECCRSFMLW